MSYYRVFDGYDYLLSGYNSESKEDLKDALVSLIVIDEEEDSDTVTSMTVEDICAARGWEIEESEEPFEPHPFEDTQTTMKTKHTPGPWWVDDDGFVASGFGDDYETVADPLGNEANAKLIAAAPDLLEALTLLMGRLEFHGSIDPIREEGPIQDAINAIKKATE